MGGVAVFLLVVLTVVVGVHAYLYKRLVRDTTTPGRVRRIGLVAVIALAVLLPVTLVLGRALGPEQARWVAWPGYIWLGLMFYLLVFLLLLELPRLVIGLALRRRPALREGPGAASAPKPVDSRDQAPTPATPDTAPEPDRSGRDTTGPRQLSRRLVLARSTAAIAGVAAGSLVGYGMTQALGDPRVHPVRIGLRGLGPGLEGLRIAVVSDIHLGPTLGRSHTERIVRTINEQQPDLVAIVGDLVDGTVAELGDDAGPLRDLTSRHGSFFVTGNHEYFSGADPWVAELERLGVQPLRNERTRITVGGDVLELAGVDDLAGEEEGGGPDFERALDGRDADRPLVLLAHQPVQVHEAARHGVDLQLSGHTHGGQLYPFHWMIRAEQPVVSGLASFGDTQLYVTNGAGFWGPPVRVGAPPEVVMVELTGS